VPGAPSSPARRPHRGLQVPRRDLPHPGRRRPGPVGRRTVHRPRPSAVRP
jgi:hypothetical protein